jgi:hypothetical protein
MFMCREILAWGHFNDFFDEVAIVANRKGLLTLSMPHQINIVHSTFKVTTLPHLYIVLLILIKDIKIN